MRLSKKGQSVMMFASVINPENVQAKVDKTYTSKILAIWQSNLNNNHMDVQVRKKAKKKKYLALRCR